MRKTQMHNLRHNGNHACAPKEWRGVPNTTGDYDLDGTIMRRPNKDLPQRLDQYLTNGNSYGPLTGYRGYHNYGKDS
jgi:hypothetical protein